MDQLPHIRIVVEDFKRKFSFVIVRHVADPATGEKREEVAVLRWEPIANWQTLEQTKYVNELSPESVRSIAQMFYRNGIIDAPSPDYVRREELEKVRAEHLADLRKLLLKE